MVVWWWILPALVGVIGLAILLGGIGALARGRVFVAGAEVLGGGAVLAVAAAITLSGLDLQTYRRLTYEAPVATIETHKKGPRLFDAILTELPSSSTQAPPRTYEINGDEWRIEARVLKFKPWANVLGLNTQYRLDRLSGRYEDTESELHAPRSVYDLAPPQNNRLDLWLLARQYGRSLPVVDALYGGGAFMPMAEGARYEVWITQNGLLARPINTAANDASGSGWR